MQTSDRRLPLHILQTPPKLPYGATATRSGVQVAGMLLHKPTLLLLLVFMGKETCCRSCCDTVLRTWSLASLVPTYMRVPSELREALRGTGFPARGIALSVP